MEVILSFVTSSFCTRTRNDVSDVFSSRNRSFTKEKVYCPVCHGEVIIRAGPVITPHFAHQAKQDCPANRGGEGPVHEKGKLLLYQWLKKHNVDVRLEHYLPNIQQQPDLFLQLNKQRIAIEYQCSKI